MGYYTEKFLAWLGAMIVTLIFFAIPICCGLAIAFNWSALACICLWTVGTCEVLAGLCYITYKVLLEDDNDR